MHNCDKFPHIRHRRIRQNGFIRELVQEHRLHASDLIWPVFVMEGKDDAHPIATLPGLYRYTIDRLVEECKKARDLGIPAIALFPVTPEEKKSDHGEESYNPQNLMCRAIAAIKKQVPGLGIVADVALDPYTSHGHDGIIRDNYVQNDETLEILCKQALNQAKAGADIIAPSDMMDGRIGAIRGTLESHGFSNTILLSYAAKYASCFYGPFRDAVGSSGNLTGDKKTYQMNPANTDEALREIASDIDEGADMIMVKPGMPYLDIIRRAKDNFNVPISAYQVSGEYAMLKFAAEHQAFGYEQSLMESLLCFKRAGVNFILTYGAIDAANILKEQ